jgi:hypothetical protein
MITRLDHILQESRREVSEAIGRFWGLPESPPTAEHLLSNYALRMIKINTDGNHELQLSDVADLIGGHDLKIELDSRLQPVSAHFDG